MHNSACLTYMVKRLKLCMTCRALSSSFAFASSLTQYPLSLFSATGCPSVCSAAGNAELSLKERGNVLTDTAAHISSIRSLCRQRHVLFQTPLVIAARVFINGGYLLFLSEFFSTTFDLVGFPSFTFASQKCSSNSTRRCFRHCVKPCQA